MRTDVTLALAERSVTFGRFPRPIKPGQAHLWVRAETGTLAATYFEGQTLVARDVTTGAMLSNVLGSYLTNADPALIDYLPLQETSSDPVDGLIAYGFDGEPSGVRSSLASVTTVPAVDAPPGMLAAGLTMCHENTGTSSRQVRLTRVPQPGVDAITVALWARWTSYLSFDSLYDYSETGGGAPTGMYRAYIASPASPTEIPFVPVTTNRAGAQYNASTSPTTLSVNTWYHLAAVYTQTAVISFINGVQIRSQGIGSAGFSPGDPATFKFTVARTWRGQLAGVGVWRRQLSVQELAALASGQ